MYVAVWFYVHNTQIPRTKSPGVARPPITQITDKQQMHMNRQVGKADFATGNYGDTQTYFYILPLVVNCVFAYNIFVLDIIRLAVNISQYHSRRMRADRHTCAEADIEACVYTCTHTRTHAYIHTYSFFLWLREAAYNPRRSRQIVAGPAGIKLIKFKQRQHRQLPIVQHVRFTPQRLYQ